MKMVEKYVARELLWSKLVEIPEDLLQIITMMEEDAHDIALHHHVAGHVEVVPEVNVVDLVIANVVEVVAGLAIVVVVIAKRNQVALVAVPLVVAVSHLEMKSVVANLLYLKKLLQKRMLTMETSQMMMTQVGSLEVAAEVRAIKIDY